MSVYSDLWCTYVSGQMHELGHNINLAHSWDNGVEYADQTGMMGYSYGQSNSPEMCFNAAKSWQLGWFSDRHKTVSPLDGESWSGRLYGPVDYPSTSTGDTVLLKIETKTTTDYFVMFNRQSGFNWDTREGGNQVTIVTAGENGEGYAPSDLKAKLSAGKSFLIPDFQGTGLPVEIIVTSINPSGTPAFADVTILSGTAAPTPSPTATFCDSNADCNGLFACPFNICDLNTNTCTSGCSSLLTTIADNNGSNGNMFDVKASNDNDIAIARFDIHVSGTGSYNVEVYTKTGSYATFETASSAWTSIQTATVNGQGGGNLTPLPPLPAPIVIAAGQTQAFYVRSPEAVRYTNGNSAGAMYASDSNIQFFEGCGKSGIFGATYTPRVWNGQITYAVLPTSVPDPTPAPTPWPSTSPSSTPSDEPSLAPSLPPSEEPSIEPSMEPSLSSAPSTGPSKYPSKDPSLEPSLSVAPSETASSKPSMSPQPSEEPTIRPSSLPSNDPSQEPSFSSAPSDTPSNEPSVSLGPSEVPSQEPSTTPIDQPSMEPSLSSAPSEKGSNAPSLSLEPSEKPSSDPSPSLEPSDLPSIQPSSSFLPSIEPSSDPSLSPAPSNVPSNEPSLSAAPSGEPSGIPSESLSDEPSFEPSMNPSQQPSTKPSNQPSLSTKPSVEPSSRPSMKTSAPTTFSCSDFDQTACEAFGGCKWDRKKLVCKDNTGGMMRRTRK